MSLCETAGKNGHLGHFKKTQNNTLFYNLHEGQLQIVIKWACCGNFYISFTNHRRIIKASGRVVMVVMVLHQAACFIDAQGSGGKKKKNVCFVS